MAILAYKRESLVVWYEYVDIEMMRRTAFIYLQIVIDVACIVLDHVHTMADITGDSQGTRRRH